MYDNPEFIQEFYRGHEEAGGVAEEAVELGTHLFEVIHCARGVRWWWDNLGILHRATPELLERLLVALRKLDQVSWACARKGGTWIRFAI